MALLPLLGSLALLGFVPQQAAAGRVVLQTTTASPPPPYDAGIFAPSPTLGANMPLTRRQTATELMRRRYGAQPS